MTLTEKTAYIKGLAEGLSLDEAKAETKIINKLIEVLEEAALTISDLEERIDDLEAYAEELDEDLGEVENIIYDPAHIHGDCDCDCCDCEDDDEYDYDDDDDFGYDDEDDEVIEVECPGCGEVVCLPTSIDLAHVLCPACGEEFSCICDCDDCDCDCEDCDGDCDEDDDK